MSDCYLSYATGTAQSGIYGDAIISFVEDDDG